MGPEIREGPHRLQGIARAESIRLVRHLSDDEQISGRDMCKRPHEARLGREEFKKEVHTFGAAYKDREIRQILKYSDSIVFNSFYQLQKYGEMARKKGVQVGLRVNPGHAEVATEMYNPCAPYSRLGILHDVIQQGIPEAQEPGKRAPLSRHVRAELRRTSEDSQSRSKNSMDPALRD